jgi:hypothetical protein
MPKDMTFDQEMQEFISITVIGPSALRNQGAKEVIKIARKFLAKIKLSLFNTNSENDYLRVLDNETEKLTNNFPNNAQNWGAARKALNLFLREIFNNKFLGRRLNIREEWMEIPLDNLIAKKLKKQDKLGKLPAWRGIKRLKPKDSIIFQEFAKDWASEENTTRVRLDMRLWMSEREPPARRRKRFL